MHPLTGVRKPVRVEAVKKMSNVMLKVSNDIQNRVTRLVCSDTSSLIQLHQKVISSRTCKL